MILVALEGKRSRNLQVKPTRESAAPPWLSLKAAASFPLFSLVGDAAAQVLCCSGNSQKQQPLCLKSSCRIKSVLADP